MDFQDSSVDVRTSYVHFMLSFLFAGDTAIIKEFLEKKTKFSQVHYKFERSKSSDFFNELLVTYLDFSRLLAGLLLDCDPGVGNAKGQITSKSIAEQDEQNEAVQRL